MIICAAIKISHTDIMGNPLEDLIVCGHRHGNCYRVKKISRLKYSECYRGIHY